MTGVWLSSSLSSPLSLQRHAHRAGETGQPRFTVLQTPLRQVQGHGTHSLTPSLQLGPWTQGLKGRVTRSLPRGPATPSSLGSTFRESLREAQFLRYLRTRTRLLLVPQPDSCPPGTLSVWVRIHTLALCSIVYLIQETLGHKGPRISGSQQAEGHLGVHTTRPSSHTVSSQPLLQAHECAEPPRAGWAKRHPLVRAGQPTLGT